MPKYLKIPPDPDASPCHCGDGNPDCDHWESCDGCGADYRKHEGHDCIDGVPVQDLRALAKELRDERDAANAELSRLRSSPAPDGQPILAEAFADNGAHSHWYLIDAKTGSKIWSEAPDECAARGFAVSPAPVIRDPDDDDWDAFGFQQGTKAEVLRIWNRAMSRSPAPVVGGVPDITDEDYESVAILMRDHGIGNHNDESEEFRRIVAATWQCCQAYAVDSARAASRLPALKPGERRVGPDEVVVGREEWEAVQEFADLIVPIRDNLSGISWIGKLSDVFAAYDRWYAVRISAQAPGQRKKR